VVIGEQDVCREVVLTSTTPPAETQATLTLRIVHRKAGAGMTPVPDAAVVIKRVNQVFKQSQSGPDGMARIQLPAGTYQIDVSKVAFATVRLDMTMGQTDVTREVELWPMCKAIRPRHVSNSGWPLASANGNTTA
jgi:hypothetical protein